MNASPTTSSAGFERPVRHLDKASAWLTHPPGLPLASRAVWVTVIRRARCADSSLDADQWFPVSTEAEKAGHEAAAAIAICETCPVRSQCLALSLRHWDIGQHGIWGGLLPAERARLRRVLANVTSITQEYSDGAAGIHQR